MQNLPSVDNVYKIFRQLNRIPRPSHHEDRVALFLTRFAEKLGLEYEKDAENNVVIRKPATPGYEQAEPIVLLNHMDMVCVAADGVGYDPLHDAIRPVIEDGWMHAEGTSLGADNGIGLSMALAILQDDSIVHGPLEVLTTANEEDGMSGAEALSPDFIKGRKVINLDSEDYDSITVGAAGACIQEIGMPAKRQPVQEGSLFYDIRISGGLGGHSGVDINKGRGNVILILARILRSLLRKKNDVHLVAFEAGNAAASIPSFGVLHLALPGQTNVTQFKMDVKAAFAKEIRTYEKNDPGLKLSIVKGKPAEKTVIPEDTAKLIGVLGSIPNGPLAMRDDMPGTVQTSSNIGLISTKSAFFDIFTHSRSFSDDELLTLSTKIALTFREAEGSTRVVMNAPAWQEKQDSPFMQLVDDTFQDELGFRPRKVAMHFVLEAGYYVEKYPGIQIASIGPRILEPHSPSERVELCTVEDIWKVTLELLARLAKQA